MVGQSLCTDLERVVIEPTMKIAVSAVFEVGLSRDATREEFRSYFRASLAEGVYLVDEVYIPKLEVICSNTSGTNHTCEVAWEVTVFGGDSVAMLAESRGILDVDSTYFSGLADSLWRLSEVELFNVSSVKQPRVFFDDIMTLDGEIVDVTPWYVFFESTAEVTADIGDIMEATSAVVLIVMVTTSVMFACVCCTTLAGYAAYRNGWRAKGL